MNINEACGDTPRADGWGGRGSVSNRSNGAGQLVMMQFALIGIGAGAAAALLFASVTSGSLAVDPAVLSGAAADHDRRARLEPLGGA